MAEVHEIIKPLSWILGKWRGENGKGIYPTIKDFSYIEELEFTHCGQPNIQFSAYSWHAETKKPLHREVGYLRIKPGTNQIAYISAQNTGVTEIEEGEYDSSSKSFTLTSQSISRISFSKDPRTLKVTRAFKLDGNNLEQLMHMETSTTPLSEHLRITYTKMAE